MTSQLEADLRQALSARVTDIPSGSGERLCRLDYRPRTTRVSSPVTVSALGAAAATAGIVVSVVLGGSEAAFAGWTADPTPPASGQTAAADANCLSQLESLPDQGVAASDGSWQPVGSDIRGPFSLVVLQNGAIEASCFVGPSLSMVSRNAVDGSSMAVSGGSHSPVRSESSSIVLRAAGSGDLGHLSVAHLDSSQGSYTVVEGEVDPEVSSVTLVRSDGEDIGATTGNGWFLAWWPGDLSPTGAELTTPSGTSSQPLALSARPPVPPGAVNCGSTPGPTTTATVVCGHASGGPGTAPAG